MFVYVISHPSADLVGICLPSEQEATLKGGFLVAEFFLEGSACRRTGVEAWGELRQSLFFFFFFASFDSQMSSVQNKV